TLQRILAYFPADQRPQIALDLSMSLQGIISQRLLPTADSSGRALAVELLTMSPAAARLVREQRVDELYDLMRASDADNIITFNDSLLELYRHGRIDHETGHAFATNPDEFALAAKGMRTGVAAFRERSGPGGSQGLDMKSLLGVAVERGASDLHLAVGRPPMLRISGELVPLELPPLTGPDMRILLYSILSVRQRAAYELERELDFALQLDRGNRFRINAYYQRGSMAASLRAIPTKVPDAESLQLPKSLMEMCRKPHGLMLVVGPTGSGKTTTLACLIDAINRERSCRIITIEDPIEYSHVGVKATIDQRELHDDTKSFASALKYVLRQDPDVILVGEMRDLETIGSALTAAETGHLVLATLHTNDAAQAIDRIIDVFPSHQQGQARSQLAASLVGVVSQRLLPRADGRGRVPAFEILGATTAVRTLIREDKMHQALGVMETSRSEGMVTMDRALHDLLKANLITRTEALRYARHPQQVTGDERIPHGAAGTQGPFAKPQWEER
ncbi:MAG: PilT/PilU family type 4a pilus ATPase, partial [Planctomycetota bacterium]